MSSIEFLPLAVNPDDYARPILSMLPYKGRRRWIGRSGREVPSAFLGAGEFFVHGRYALVEALRRAGVGPGGAVLLPAYHCRTIVESALYLGAEVRFYPMTADLKPDFASLDRLNADGAVRAMLVTHYFGFANDVVAAEAYCSQHGIALVEDCAHAFYGAHEGRTLGTIGQYSIASAWKFLPVRDGAMLRDNTATDGSLALAGQGPLKEAKAAAALLEARVARLVRRPDLQAPEVSELLRQARKIAAAGPRQKCTDDMQFNRGQVGMAGLRLSCWQIAHTPHDEVARHRRARYRQWLDGVRDVPGVRPLFPDLPDGVVPYAFPLVTDAGGMIFHALRLARIPIWRWEDVAVTSCPVALDYRLRLLQLPCHQDLSEREIDWMLRVLRGVAEGLAQTADARRGPVLVGDYEVR